jgi:hypothetical protein
MNMMKPLYMLTEGLPGVAREIRTEPPSPALSSLKKIVRLGVSDGGPPRSVEAGYSKSISSKKEKGQISIIHGKLGT